MHLKLWSDRYFRFTLFNCEFFPPSALFQFWCLYSRVSESTFLSQPTTSHLTPQIPETLFLTINITDASVLPTSHSQLLSMDFPFNNYLLCNILCGSSNTFLHPPMVVAHPPPDATCWRCPYELPSTPTADATSGGGKPVQPVHPSSHATFWGVQ